MRLPHLFHLSIAVSVLGLTEPAMPSESPSKTVIGRIEHVRLPDWNIQIEAKIDTGAYRSSLHVDQIEPIDGQPNLIRFRTTDRRGAVHTIEAKVERYIRVRSSFGQNQKRPVVRLRLCLGGRVFRSTVSLSDRGDLRYRMLIGRRLLAKHFLVDVALANTHTDACGK